MFTNEALNCLAPDFFFSADSALTQCGMFPFNHYDGATKPVTIFVGFSSVTFNEIVLLRAHL